MWAARLAMKIALLVIISISCSLAFAQAQSPQQTLNQYISNLQKNPNDYALREKIIRHVQAMKPAPGVSMVEYRIDSASSITASTF